MTLPVPNMQAPLVSPNSGKILPPWNSFFQQLVQPAPAVVNITASPFTANANGKVIIIGAVTIDLTRGSDTVSLTDEIIPVRIGDTVAWTGPATVQYWGD